MTHQERAKGVCKTIHENTIELHAMGRLQEMSVRQHLEMCDFCKGRVAEHRSWIEDLKQALQQFQQANEPADARGADTRGSAAKFGADRLDRSGADRASRQEDA